MTQGAGAPVGGAERIATLDIIRGFALFGVLWMNLYEHADIALPEGKVIHLFGDRADQIVSFFSAWLMLGKAQALFSFLFGLGFALFLERAGRRGADGRMLYLRRLGFLLLLGIAHIHLLWVGDILNAYAAVGFVLVLTRRWPRWALVGVGLSLILLPGILMRLYFGYYLGLQQPPWFSVQEALVAPTQAAFMGHDYRAYVTMLYRQTWEGFYLWPNAWMYLATILGRFLLGSWVYRRGWFQDVAGHAAAFRRWMPWLLAGGLVLAAVNPLLGIFQVKTPGVLSFIRQIVGISSNIVLPAGYAALFAVRCLDTRWLRRFAGLGAAGRMALTNYLTQSVVYFFVLYGFGLGLLPYMGPLACLLLALVVYAVQIAVSRWWLAHHHFGPAEWVWRWATYGERQPLRRLREEAALPA